MSTRAPDVHRLVSLVRSSPIRALVLAAAGLVMLQAACTSVEVVGVRISSLEVAPGSVTITVGAVRQFTATVRDEGGTPIPQAQVTWSVDQPSVAQIDANGLATGVTAGGTNVRATFQGTSGQATLIVEPGNAAPTATITAPAAGSSFVDGELITFTGTATDPEDGPLSGASLAWTSQIDGTIGTGPAFSTSALSVGTHIITLRATDSGGAVGTSQIGITVGLGPAPTVTSITPNRGPPTGGTPTTIVGTGFEAGATVTIGGTPATNVVRVNATTITATTPAGAIGTVDVVVTNPDTQSGTLVGGFAYTAGPTVTSITPSGGTLAGGTQVTIAGSGFETGASVTIGGTPATNVVVGSSTSITATTPPGSAGAADVVVTNPDTRAATLAGGYTYAPAPTVTSITPATGPTGGGTAVAITGTGFVPGATVTLGGVAATNVVWVSPTDLTATTALRAPGVVDVVVTNPDAQTGVLAGGYTYAPGPAVASITPSGGNTAGGTPVTIAGAGFVSGATVTIGGVAATGVVWVDSMTITAVTPAGAAGPADVVVTNPDAQTSTLVGGYTYAPAPTVTSITPNTGPTAGGTGVTITGADFVSGATVTIGGTPATGVVFVDPTSITATSPGNPAGAADVVVTNPDAQAGTLAGGFTYLPGPAVASITPNSGPTAGGTAVTLTGTGFVSGATVTIGGAAATGVVFVDPTSITAVTPAGVAGPADVVVTNPDTQTSTLVGGFTYVPPPTVTSIGPSNGPASGGTAVTIGGTDFVSGATVTIGGVAATGVVFVNATSLTATTPAGPAGAADVVVTNPDTQAGTLVGGFTYDPPPTVTSISPNTGPTAGGTAVTITGTDFVVGATVTIGGVAATNVGFVNSTSLTALTPGNPSGAADVVVTNPDTQTGTLAGGFTYLPGPAVTSIAPNTGPTAGGTAVTITGTGFVSGATVTIGGAAATGVVFVNATSLTATTPAGSAGAADVVVTNPDAQTSTLAGGFTYVPPPTVTSISPNSGPTAGGTAVTIGGAGFVSGATVTIGGAAATSVVFVNATSLTATTPAGAVGTADVVVTNPDAQVGTLTNGFTYDPAPTVTSISPNTGPTAGGTSVTITGTDFVVGATVTIGGVAATNVGFVNSTSLTALTPGNSSGAADVVVTNPDAQTGTLAGGFTYLPGPAVTSISPTSGPTAGGTAVTITGTGFVSGATVTIGGAAATGVVFVNATSLTATTPAGSAGAADVVVTNPDAQTSTLAGGFTYLPPPTVTSITPNSGPTAGGTAVTIAGTGFVSGATVTIDGVAATGVTFVNATSLTATTPAGAVGAADVVVTNPDAQAGTLLNGFTYVPPAPTVTSVSPNTGLVSGGTSITITGTDFVAVPTVTIGGVAATNVGFFGSTSITATTPAGAEGAADVVVTNPDAQSGTLVGGFTYVLPAPTVASISPNTGPTAGGTSVTITGTNFVSGATVTVGGVAATGVVFGDATSITATTPAGAAGAADVVVTNPDAQTATLAGGFTYVPPPTVTSIAPNTGLVSGGTSVTITGTDFVSGATVTVGGVAATGVTFNNSTSISATTPAGSAGAADVVVTNPDGQTGTLAGGFTYMLPAPTVTSISPNSGPTAGGTSVTITGTNFVSGATVTVGGVAATGVTFNNATSISASTPAGSAGAEDVVVTNPDAQTGTLAGGFTYIAPAPTVTSISPNTGTTTGGTSVTISGTDFVSGATVTVGGVAATGVIFGGATSLTATTPAGAAGTADVVVTNPDAQAGTLVSGFTYVAPPTVTSISPNTGPTAGGTSVTITGTDFVSGATVTVGGVAATSVVFGDATSITADTPAGTAGTADVVVTNPDAQAGTLVGGFTYVAPPTVTSITPNSGPTAGATSVTITGTDFVSGATVTIGGVAATGVVFNNSTSLSATTPAGTAGAVDVVVTNPDAQTGTLVGGFTYVAPPTVTSISPNTGTTAGGESVTITGTDFVSGATVTIGGVAATGVVFNNSTSITVTTPAGAAGAADVVVTNPDAQTGTLVGGFTYS